MNKTLILNARIITLGKVLPDYCLRLEEGKIVSLFPADKLQGLDADTEIFDAQDAYAAPGFIDAHIHGFGGFGPELGTQEALLQMSSALAEQGVTAFCPTLYCARPEQMLRIIQNTVGAFGKEKGAHLLGYHLEGPFISPQKPGVMKPQDITAPDISVLERLWHAAHGHISSMTLAPELPGLEKIIAFCRTHHILLQAGHTNATYEQFLHGAKQGISHVTHLFNAMRPFTHREPGAAGAALMTPDISAEIIADGLHVRPEVIHFLSRVKPAQNISLVTDALLPTGQKNPPFTANGEEVILDGGVWKRKADGVIAGSALTMLQGIKNLVSFGFTLPQACACAAENPARLLELKTKGRLAPGYDGDIVIFDKDFRLKKVFLA